ncbi:amino acid permease [Micromonospora sp. WMMD1128]|uniref:amino acid permease n=1 Tax=Micromonospora sp. WMMD1128 TaxID=3015150 RepID=UPI00248B6279|nr:amino acid permease [Micromonospora sp. WMMD1128]WBB75663.1 amino acid permease [Micromonospora sp. WMMD1128]
MATPSPTGGASLRRDLSGRQLRMIGLGGAIGTGLFLGSGQAISTAGPAVTIAYAIGGAVAVTLAYALARMIAAHPEVGGFGGMAERYLGRGPAFAQRWWYWIAQVVNIGGEALAVGIYLKLWWPELPLWVPAVLFATLVLVVNSFTVGVFGEFEYWFAMIKVIAIVVFVGLGAVAVFVGLGGRPATGLSAWTDHGGFAPHGMSGIWLGMVLVTFSYMGTEALAVAAGEARTAGRDVVSATRGVVLRLLLFYVLGTAVVVSIVPWTEAAAGGSVDASPFVRLFDIAGVPAAVHVMNLVVLTAALSAMNTNVYVASRTLYGLAGSGQAPRVFGRVNRRGVPLPALLVSGAGLLLAALLAAVVPERAFLALVGLSLSGAVLTWILILATYLAYRRAERPADPVLAGAVVLAIVVLAAVLVTMAVSDTFSVPVLSGAPLLLAVLVAYAVHARHRRSVGVPEPDAAEPVGAR